MGSGEHDDRKKRFGGPDDGEHVRMGVSQVLDIWSIVVVIIDKSGHGETGNIFGHGFFALGSAGKAQIDMIYVQRAAENIFVGVAGA